ncbi:hypothetical protein J416_01679 [Gracilibacillus halophilus YIM-C55.5]|uniref:Uncharacterized protein n=1 Tax=Gracilibacillus halophilus YIM-C55.5 TaxID=1308866 RepID=N4WFW9_9BACI|nr:hypothetical protein [Gracilibacillus halophilus]ENH98164.1 hypothetical protein J416_01679 [Gracilibacillus halophilus YIM-C55.5]
MKRLYIFFAFVFLLHIISVLYPNEILNDCLGILAFLMFVISFHKASRLFQILGVLFIVTGTSLYFSADLSIHQLPPILAGNLSLLTLLAMLPWMNSVVAAGRFDRLLQQLLRGNVKDLGMLYQRSITAMMSLTAFLNVSSATISQDVLVDNLKPVKRQVANKFIMMATLRGYSLALPWSPLEVLVAMAIFITGVNFAQILPIMMIITIVMYAIDSMWGRYYFGRYHYPLDEDSVNTQKARHKRRKILQLIVALLSFLVIVVLLGNLFDLEFIFIVTVIVFPFAFVWSLFMKRFKSFWTIGWNKWKDNLNHMQNFIVLFVTLAFFTGTLNESPALQMIQDPIIAVSNAPLLILIMIQLLFIFMSMFGVHPIATMGVLGGISTMLMDILSPLSLAVILITSGVATVPIGTYGLVVTITSMSLRQSPYYITFYNLPYSFLFGAVGIFVAYLLI